MTELDVPSPSLVLIAWSSVWSPVVSAAWLHAAWRMLDLPDDADLRDTQFCSTFHVGMPAPRVPLLLHAALDRPGDLVRMDWMRVMQHLSLKLGDEILPPDHLAIGSEICAHAVARDEEVIVDELLSRYLLPWCDVAARRLGDEDVACHMIVARFRALLDAL